jgi:adenosylcobinamide-GDP ribazoletransferase
MKPVHRRADDIVTAIGLLTRLPIGTGNAAGLDPARATWAYPLAGIIVGMVGGAVYGLSWWIGLPALVAAALAFGTMLLATGGLHEDGLADTADGFGGGADRDRKLAIMRDSRIGSFGVLALIVAFAIRFGAVTDLATPLSVGAALIASAALSRAAMVTLMWRLPNARPGGLSARVGTPPDRAACEALALGALAALLLLPAWTAVAAVLAAALAAAAVAMLARRQIGGQTGDVLGAAGIAAECAALAAIIAVT